MENDVLYVYIPRSKDASKSSLMVHAREKQRTSVGIILPPSVDKRSKDSKRLLLLQLFLSLLRHFSDILIFFGCFLE